jgi:hypothetical protein
MQKEAIASYIVKCKRTGTEADASVTVYNTGSRDVGCQFLWRGNCSTARPCEHLYPTMSSDRVDIEK